MIVIRTNCWPFIFESKLDSRLAETGKLAGINSIAEKEKKTKDLECNCHCSPCDRLEINLTSTFPHIKKCN